MPPQASPLAFWRLKPPIVGRGLDRERVVELHDPGLERAGRGDDLHRRAGRLQCRERDAGERQHARRCADPSPRSRRSWPPIAAIAARSIAGLIVVVTDAAGDRRGAREHAIAGQQRAARLAGELVLEDPLEPVEPDLRVGRIAQRRVASAASAAGSARACRRSGWRRRGSARCGRALRQRRPVAGEQRPRAAAASTCRISRSPGTQPREQQRRGEAARSAPEPLPRRAAPGGSRAACRTPRRATRTRAPGSRRRRGRRRGRGTTEVSVAVLAALRYVGRRTGPRRRCVARPSRAASTCARSRRAPRRARSGSPAALGAAGRGRESTDPGRERQHGDSGQRSRARQQPRAERRVGRAPRAHQRSHCLGHLNTER